jgi:tetratricopeptide (TPR) repeat protein
VSDRTGDKGPREIEGHVDHDDSTKDKPGIPGRVDTNKPADAARPASPIRLGGGRRLADVLPSDDESDALLDSLFADLTDVPEAAAPAPPAPPPIAATPAPATPMAGTVAAFEASRRVGTPLPPTSSGRPAPIPREEPEPEPDQSRGGGRITMPAPALAEDLATEHELGIPRDEPFSVPRDDDEMPEQATALIDADMARVLADSMRGADVAAATEVVDLGPDSDRTPPPRRARTPIPPPLAAAPAIEPAATIADEPTPTPDGDDAVFDLDAQGEVATEIWEGAGELPASEPEEPASAPTPPPLTPPGAPVGGATPPPLAPMQAAPPARSATPPPLAPMQAAATPAAAPVRGVTPPPLAAATPAAAPVRGATPPPLAPMQAAPPVHDATPPPLEAHVEDPASDEDGPEIALDGGPEVGAAPVIEVDVAPPAASPGVPPPIALGAVAARVSPRVAAPAAPSVAGASREAFASRSQWLRSEAAAIQDPAARSRALLVASELAALAGDEAEGLAIAREAYALAPSSPLASRQVRGLAQRDGDHAAIVEILDAEARVAPTPEARAHASLVAAEVLRRKLDDRDGASKRVEAASRALPHDPRPFVQRFCEALADADRRGDPAAGASLARFRVPDAAGLAPIAAAFNEVAVLRADGPELASKSGWARPREGAQPSAHEGVLRARAALGAGDLAGAVSSVYALGRGRGLAGGAGWLAGVLAAPRPETRPLSVRAFRGVVEGSHGPLASRALVARSIEAGDAAGVRAALDAAPPGAFSAADRIAIAALGGAGRPDIDPFVDETVRDAQLAPLAVAATSALSSPAEPDRVVLSLGSRRASAAIRLGRALAAGPASGESVEEAAADLARARVTDAIRAYVDAAPDAGLARSLALELDVESRAVGNVARAVSGWSDANVAGPAHEAERDRALAGALLAEVAGDTERAAAEYERACALDPGHEGAVRARASFQASAEAASALVELGESLPPGPRAALLLVEAAIRLADANPDVDVDVDTEVPPATEAERLFQTAAELDGGLPFASHFGERIARGRGDREHVLEWLRRRREAADDAVERALDLVREALLVADESAATASSLLEQALASRPSDLGLRELYERLSPELPADRAEWRAARVAESTGAEAARLALEAAFELERSGDMARVAELARAAIAAGERALAPIVAYRAALAGHRTSEAVDELLPQVRALGTPEERLDVYERLAELDELGRNDAASGLLWRKTILEELPAHLPTLRRVIAALAAAGREGEIEPVALAVAKALEGPEATAHAILSARLRLRALGWDEMREPLDVAYAHEPRALWVLRQVAAHARARGDHAMASLAEEQLADRVDRPLESATLLLRAAQASKQGGDLGRARQLLARAVELEPQHVLAHLELAEVLAAAGEHAAAAEAFEASADVSAVPEESLRELYRAAVLWGDQVGDKARARAALERVTAVNPAYEEAFDRLRALYLADGARAELAALLERRLDSVTDPAERVEMEVLRGRTLAEVGDAGTAKRALARALEESPDHVDALEAFAELCTAEGDWTGAEQALIRLARLVPDPARQAAVYLRLGALYDEPLPNPERAELAYQEILKRAPADVTARERLVALYARTGNTRGALEQQTALVNDAEAPEAKCQRTVELARLHEESGDPKKAEATLLSARKTWPKDDAALLGLAQFYQRTGQAQAGQVLLDRAVADARRALSTGRFEPYLFGTLATVATLRNKPDAASIARSIVAALDGADAAPPEGAGPTAGDASLDDLLAPEVLTPAFRELLRATGPLLDAAVPYDLGSIRAAPLPLAHAELGERIREIAASYGLFAVHVQVSSVLGAVCVAASAHPPTLVLGQSLVASPRADVREFLVHRAMKVLQANAAVLSRTAPIDLWPLVAAYLKTLVPTFNAPGVDAAKLGDWSSKLAKAAPPAVDPHLATLASDVIGSIGNRASTLNTVVNGWGDRAALLALGDPNVALAGIASAGGHANAPPPAGKDRVTWIGRNTEARELVIFAVSDAYAEARARLGLAG